MRSRPVIAVIAVCTVLVTSAAASEAVTSTPRAGSACTKAGAYAISGLRVFKCSAAKKWVLHSRVKASGTCPLLGLKAKAPSGSLTCRPTADGRRWTWDQRPEAYLPPTTVGAPVDACKVLDHSFERLNYRGGLAGGFPTPVEPVKRPGVLRMALVPVDWADLPGEPDPLSRVKDQMLLFSQWYEMVSGNRITVEWVVHDRWVRIPGNSATYSVPRSTNYGVITTFGRDALAAADPSVDFTNVDVVNFILPKGQTIMGDGGQVFPNTTENGDYRTNEGRITSFTVPGRYFDTAGRSYWTYWAHEVGHFLQIAHVGTSYEWSDMHGYDLMGSQDGPFRTLNSWLRFMKQWLNDDQIYCQTRETLQPTTLMLAPLDGKLPGIKSAMIRTGPESIVVIESRRGSKFDCGTSARNKGVLVFAYDATKGNQQTDWLKPTYPAGRSNYRTGCGTPPLTDALLTSGEAVTIQGLTIRVLASKQYDTIQLQAVQS